VARVAVEVDVVGRRDGSPHRTQRLHDLDLRAIDQVM
jgi:hypothetical protein